MTPILPSRREGQAHTAGHPPSPFPLAQQPAAAKAWFRAPAPARRISGAAEPSGRRLRPWAKWVDSGSSGPWGRKQSHHTASSVAESTTHSLRNNEKNKGLLRKDPPIFSLDLEVREGNPGILAKARETPYVSRDGQEHGAA